MYSRNFTTENTASGIRLNPNVRIDKPKTQKDNIPVKSFTDNFAYERFNRMGTQKENGEAQIYLQNNREKENESQIEETSLAVTESNTVTDVQKDDNKIDKKDIYDKGILSRLKFAFDADTLLIILAVAMLLFSDNATNDKLTPLALLAILFL